MLTNKAQLKYSLIITCMAVCLLLGIKNVSAETIFSGSSLETTIWDDSGNWDWGSGDSFSITSIGTGLNVGFEPGELLFDSDLKFEIVAEYTEKNQYIGNFLVTDLDDPNTVYLNAMFDGLTLKYLDDVFFFFETSGVSSVSGQWMDTLFSDMAVSLINGGIVSWGSNLSFLGSVSLEETDPINPIANPEPGTFFLFGLGMLGIARISRKKCEAA
ncbi:MAG: PEP-CTERM sorting domain-containing protein [Desulfobacterales bacterium]|nr:PEP-CTERM sorting domain-containing protein [Desulfobacterales bacterium]